MSFEVAIDFLRDHSLLHGIPENELQIAASSIETVSFADGEPLLIEGDTSDDCFFIMSGKVQVSSRNLVGKTLLLAELGSGSLVGEMGLLHNERRTARVTAIGDVVALRMEREAFELLADRSPLFYESILLTVRIRMIHRMLRSASIWSAIPDAELRGLAEITLIRKVTKSDLLVAKGSLVDQFFMITKGRVEIHGSKKQKSFLREGDFFGETGLLTDTSSEVEIVASEDSELLVMGKSEFQYVLNYYAPVRKQFLEIVRIRTPHLLSKVALEYRDEIIEEEQKPVPPKAKERWVDILLWLGGGFVVLSIIALFLQSNWLNIAALIVGGIVGPVTFVSFIRSHQLLGFSQARLGLVFLLSAIIAVPLAWFLERIWLFDVGVSHFDFAHFRLPLSVSVIEESAKLLVCIALVRTKQMHFLMDAVVFGAAAGMGFAAIESVIYGWSHLEGASSVGMFSVLWIRALLSPFGHGTWTAIAAAAIWFGTSASRSKGLNKASSWSKVWRAAALLTLVILLHAMWDFRFTNGLAKMGMMVSVGIVGLTLLYFLIRAGRREELHALTTLNPYVQESLRFIDPEEKAADELRCDSCGTVSPKETRYCARCGHALRMK
ncbi:cyclic nucleotide-binding domain-containing protein [Cohnella abietis]|uniref:Cyclic nucleotide-binding domain-containing protein n=1 Tax=Cohnella abietis TaxID=2507935 RepID=A0A3T1DC31_9BACL|nr:cyclic nucleotide-binding domain-containing protein [Cohnella abietis]BBI35495.1 hypothetical protein KCTCHS21_48940 [Cohnella abietis]